MSLPNWSIDLVRRRLRSMHGVAAPELPPIMLVTMRHQVQTVAACCALAAAAGVRPGMTLAHARAMLERDDAVIQPHQPQRDAQALHRLAMWASRFSPTVADDPPDGLLIDITGCQRVFGGEKRLALRLLADLGRLGIHARVAAASTFACAWGVCRFGERDLAIIAPGGERAALEPLPIGALRVDEDLIEALQEVEVLRVHQLLALPRGSLAARFSAELLWRLDQALGQAMEAIKPVRPIPPWIISREFDGPVLQPQAIALATRSLLDLLSAQLLSREQGVRRLHVELQRVDAGPIRLTLTLSQPTRRAAHLWSLLEPRLEKVNLGHGVERIDLHAADASLLPHHQVSSWPDVAASRQAHLRQASELIDTLVSRLGADHVLRIEPVESHLPEQAFARRSARDAGEASVDSEARPLRPASRPAAVLEPPRPAQVEVVQQRPVALRWGCRRHPIIDRVGPERIASAWWRLHQRTVRDYYRLQDDAGRWWWVFRERGNGEWFVHGLWA